MCSETSSPRLSFSNDVSQTEVNLALQDNRRDSSLLELSCDFEFSFNSSLSTQESSSADELFSHGIILPIQPRDSNSLPPLPTFPSHNLNTDKPNQIKSATKLLSNFDTRNNSDHQIKPHSKSQSAQNSQASSKSFWGSFKRSSSLNCEKKRSLLCSLPLLSRSNSTGSVPNKRNSFKEANKNNNSQKQPLISMVRSSSSSSSSSLSNSYSMKPPLKKSYGIGGSYGNSVRIIPVINVPPPYISKGTAKFFGLGSFLHHGNERKSKK